MIRNRIISGVKKRAHDFEESDHADGHRAQFKDQPRFQMLQILADGRAVIVQRSLHRLFGGFMTFAENVHHRRRLGFGKAVRLELSEEFMGVQLDRKHLLKISPTCCFVNFSSDM